MPLVLSQNTIRLLLFPINLIVFVVCITISAYLQSIIPKYLFSDFVFWLLSPAIKIEIMMTSIILIVGFAGNISYNKCWQGSYAFFTLVLTGIFGTSYYFSTDLMHSAETVFPKIESAGAYLFERLDALYEMKCLQWGPSQCECNGNGSLNACQQDSLYGNLFYWVYQAPCQDLRDNPNYLYSDIGAKEFIMKQIKNLPEVFEKWELIGTIVIGAYTVYLFFFFLFVAETTQYQAEEKSIA